MCEVILFLNEEVKWSELRRGSWEQKWHVRYGDFIL